MVLTDPLSLLYPWDFKFMEATFYSSQEKGVAGHALQGTMVRRQEEWKESMTQNFYCVSYRKDMAECAKQFRIG